MTGLLLYERNASHLLGGMVNFLRVQEYPGWIAETIAPEDL
jgi:hypothetical protein